MSGLLGTVNVHAFVGPGVTVRASFVIAGGAVSWSQSFVLDPAQGPAAAASAQCDPPYTVDPATGRKRYKAVCLR
jgi:hypothetical protein